ncbi:hypothetical protein DMH04_29655 [Kibdelosporangium aridum]|uniref:Extracellular repeat, HAF family n=1 Tax=Kibdelosporangium aridum TaxID=2030 RepID=A0A428Z3Q1_KIBAR|nr:hypothetical protein [Kibdelosporangium aridum]RSM80697.1 hypothetical protein DMH04_29655 [Kibdelosporangium aridum]
MRFRRTAVLVCALAVTAGMATPAVAAPKIVELPTLPGATYTYAYDVNSAGVVVGEAYFPDFTGRALRWTRNGQVTELPNLSPGNSSATAINNNGTIVGWSGNQAVQWNTDGTIKVLSPLPGWIGPLRAVDIADNGTVVGNTRDADFKGRAVRYPAHSTVIEELPPLPGRVESFAMDINSSGTVVGDSDTHAARWGPDGRAEAFPTPPTYSNSRAVTIDRRGTALVTAWTPGGAGSHYRWTATGRVIPLPSPADFLLQDVSDTGRIIGAFPDSFERHAATLAPDGTTKELGALPGDIYTMGNAINATGDLVVGYSGSSNGRRPVVWRF